MRDLTETAGQEDEKKLYGAHFRGQVESDGGKVIYKAVDAGAGRIEWKVVLLRSDGVEKQVFISSTGKAKRIKSADSLFNYHKSLYPDGPTLEVPYFRPDSASDSEPVDEEDLPRGRTPAWPVRRSSRSPISSASVASARKPIGKQFS